MQTLTEFDVRDLQMHAYCLHMWTSPESWTAVQVQHAPDPSKSGPYSSQCAVALRRTRNKLTMQPKCHALSGHCSERVWRGCHRAYKVLQHQPSVKPLKLRTPAGLAFPWMVHTWTWVEVDLCSIGLRRPALFAASLSDRSAKPSSPELLERMPRGHCISQQAPMDPYGGEVTTFPGANAALWLPVVRCAATFSSQTGETATHNSKSHARLAITVKLEKRQRGDGKCQKWSQGRHKETGQEAAQSQDDVV